MLQFEIRDFKYLSRSMKSEVVISDPEVLVGNKEVTVELNFPEMLLSD